MSLQSDLADTSDVTKGDALVGFKQSCPGAVPRTVHEKLDETVSPEDFGAVNNDPSMSAQTTAAINAALSCGKPVSFKRGATYFVNDTIVFRANGVYECNHATLKATQDFPETTSDPPGKRSVAKITNTNHVTINNLRIDGDDTAQICLYLSAVIWGTSQIKNVFCEKAVLDGIVAEGTQLAAFEGIVCRRNGRHGMLCAEANAMSVIRSRFVWNGGDGVRIQKGIVDGCSGYTTTRGPSSGSVTFYACVFEKNAGNGVYNYNTTSPVIVEACWLEGNNRGYAVEAPPGSDNWVDGTEGYGIRSNGLTIVKDNLITAGANRAGTSLAILLEDDASGDVANNWFATESGPDGAKHDYVKALCTGCTFSRPNRITDNSTGFILTEIDPNAETAASIPRVVGEELLANPGFESAQPLWDAYIGNSTLVLDATIRHSGTQSLKAGKPFYRRYCRVAPRLRM